MVFKNLCVLVLWTKVASALEGLGPGDDFGGGTPVSTIICNVVTTSPEYVREVTINEIPNSKCHYYRNKVLAVLTQCHQIG